MSSGLVGTSHSQSDSGFMENSYFERSLKDRPLFPASCGYVVDWPHVAQASALLAIRVCLPPSQASKRIWNRARDGPRNAMPELARPPYAKKTHAEFSPTPHHGSECPSHGKKRDIFVFCSFWIRFSYLAVCGWDRLKQPIRDLVVQRYGYWWIPQSWRSANERGHSNL